MPMESGKVLIIDDNPENLAITSRVLKRAGYEVFSASTGTDGLRIIKEINPDLLLLDVLLPDISGYEVCRIIKADPDTWHIFVVYLTSVNRSSDVKAEGYKAGADGYITRPISNNELLAIVEAYLRLCEKAKQLKKSEERYSLLCEVSIEGIVIHDYKSIIDANGTMLKMMGYESIEELKGIPSVIDLVAPDSKDIAEQKIKSGHVGAYTLNLKRKDGSIFPAELQAKNIVLNGTKAMVVSVRDVTDRMILERELKYALEKALESSKIKSQFIANVSHELRTPLNSIIMMTELISKTKLSQEQREYMDMTRNAAESLLLIINDILDLSKIEAGRFEIENIDFDFAALLSGIFEIFSHQARQKQLALKYTLDSNIPRALRGDPARIRQVLINLIGNAIKFTEKGGISISVNIHSQHTSEEGKNIYTLLFLVSDTGRGISQEKQEHIFESFSQEDSSINRKYGGTGLGLAISLNLVRLMGGTMWVDSEIGKGSNFYFTIPLQEGSVDSLTDPQYSSPEEDKEFALKTPSGLKLLIAEDNLINQTLVKRALESEGYSVITVSSGIEALRVLSEKDDIDLVLMDMQMPEMDGIRTTRIIRGSESLENISIKNPHIPIVAITANAMKGDRDLCFAAGMNDYITKPLRIKELLMVINRNVYNRKNSQGETFEMDMENKVEKTKGDDNLIDRAKALELLGGDEEMLEQIYVMFASYAPDQVSELKDALQKEDMEKLNRISHSLKSNAGTIGCESLRLSAYQMELAAKNKDLYSFIDNFKAFQGILDRVIQEIGSLNKS